MVGKIRNNILIFILIFIASLVCITNYTPGTILSGWDTLHPEFNFGANISREISGVFRENQGLGTVSAHSAMADLPHILILYLFHFLLDQDFLRYFYIFSNLILGAIGMYLFLYKIVLKDKISAFLGGLFYLLNLGTLQQFVVPLEMFTTQYAALPWLFLFATSYIYAKNNPGKILLFFSIVTILSSPMAFAPTLWYVYLFTLISYISLMAIPQFLKRDFILAKKAFALIFLTIILNLYWILPNIYYILSHGSQVSEAIANKIFSPQAFLYNKEFGNIFDILMLKSFLFDWSAYTDSNNFGQLLFPWIKHLNSPIVLGIGLIFAFITLLGITKEILRKNKIMISFVPALFLCLLFLFNDNFPASGIYNFLKDNIPFFKEAYRFPANKVFVIFTFIYTISFAIGFAAIKKNAKRFSPPGQRPSLRVRDSSESATGPAAFLLLSIFVALIILYMSPAFGGNFISPYMKIKIPEMYFEMFEWFKTKPKDARIANLPIHSIFGWEYYNWYSDRPSFQGAGFIWFGFRQPLLNRDFDRWSKYNEQYSREMSYAIYSQNPSLLKTTLQKYNIKYILLDKSIIAPQNNPKILFHKEIQDLLENESYIQKVKDFDNTLLVYEVELKNDFSEENTVSPLMNLTDNQGRILPNFLSDIPQMPVIEKKSNEIYPKKPQKQIPIDIFSLKYSLMLCDNADSNVSFGINREKAVNSFSLFALKNHVCLTIPLKSIFTKEKLPEASLLGLSLNYKSQKPVGFCLSDLAKNMCVNYGSKTVLTNKTDHNILKYFSLENSDVGNLGITFFLDATNSNFEEKAFFENIFVSLTSSQDLSSTLLLPETSQLTYSKIKISKTRQNCKNYSFVNPFLENQTLENNESHFIEYISIDATSCDRFLYDLPQHQAYLVLITSRNISGLPLYLCIENQISKHCDINANLSPSKEFATETFLLPPQTISRNVKGYDLIINNFGIKKTISINDLKSIQIIPFSPNPSLAENESPKADLVISQSYEKGWKAYRIMNYESRIMNWTANLFPFIFGKELKNHVLVNGWANGWIIDDAKFSPQDSQLKVIFLPQYLEYLGFALLGGTLIILTFLLFRKPTQ